MASFLFAPWPFLALVAPRTRRNFSSISPKNASFLQPRAQLTMIEIVEFRNCWKNTKCHVTATKISYLLIPMTKWESFTTAVAFFVSFCDFFVEKTIPFHRRSRAFWTTKNTKFLRHLTTKNTKNHFFEIFLPKGFSPKRTQNDKKACFYLFKSSSSALTEAVSYVCSKMWFFVFFGIHTATLALQCSISRVLLRKNTLLPPFPGRESKVFTFW